jgi:membrane protein DedA with SNARE-associated domain
MINTELGGAVIEFVRTHEMWAAPTVFGLAFLESFAFLPLVVPATVILFGISGLLGAASVGFWPIYTAGVLGAFVGDWFAFELALYFSILKMALQGCGRYRSIPDFCTMGVF